MSTTLIIEKIISYLVPVIIGYMITIIKKVLKEFKDLKKDQLDDMRVDLANKFYVYDQMEVVEDYLYASFNEKCNRYFDRGGDSYIHDLYERSKKWKIKHTGVNLS